jgi:hypothetical protein
MLASISSSSPNQTDEVDSNTTLSTWPSAKASLPPAACHIFVQPLKSLHTDNDRYFYNYSATKKLNNYL